MTKKSKGNWIQDAREEMDRKGTKGAFGKATKKKIARGKKKGGLSKKRAVLAETFKKIAKRGKKRSASRSKKRSSTRR